MKKIKQLICFVLIISMMGCAKFRSAHQGDTAMRNGVIAGVIGGMAAGGAGTWALVNRKDCSGDRNDGLCNPFAATGTVLLGMVAGAIVFGFAGGGIGAAISKNKKEKAMQQEESVEKK